MTATATALSAAQRQLAELNHRGAPMGAGKYAHARRVRELEAEVARLSEERETEKVEILTGLVVDLAAGLRFAPGSRAEITRQRVVREARI